MGHDLNWRLSFIEYKESERTKHVHRLHHYKGKFIPQLVEYFLDEHTDEFKQQIYFHPGDIVLDPFCGSGTTLVQANELGLHAVGIDISAFNSMISNVKIRKHDLAIDTYIAIPYNPYEPKPYERWTNQGILDIPHELKVAEEFWDFLGGEGTYQDLLDCFEQAGLILRPEMDQYFLQFRKDD